MIPFTDITQIKSSKNCSTLNTLSKQEYPAQYPTTQSARVSLRTLVT